MSSYTLLCIFEGREQGLTYELTYDEVIDEIWNIVKGIYPNLPRSNIRPRFDEEHSKYVYEKRHAENGNMSFEFWEEDKEN